MQCCDVRILLTCSSLTKIIDFQYFSIYFIQTPGKNKNKINHRLFLFRKWQDTEPPKFHRTRIGIDSARTFYLVSILRSNKLNHIIISEKQRSLLCNVVHLVYTTLNNILIII